MKMTFYFECDLFLKLGLEPFCTFLKTCPRILTVLSEISSSFAILTGDAKVKADILKSNILINKKARDFGFFLFRFFPNLPRTLSKLNNPKSFRLGVLEGNLAG